MMASGTAIDRERERVREIGDDLSGWRRWGPYVSDRSWGTVREDYSHDGNAWGYLTYDMARAKAYRWGEDAIAGLCDRYQLLCFAPAFWRGQPRRGREGVLLSVDNTPTHSYMCLLYKYPQAAYPYHQLIEQNQRRAGQGPEYELLDTGVFEDDRYFDIFVEYAKADPEDLAIRITAHNRGPDAAPLHILPTLWFRNTWAWGPAPQPEPKITCERSDGVCLVSDNSRTSADPNMPAHYRLGLRYLYGPPAPVLFTDNETHGERAYGPGSTSHKLYTKDAFHRAICEHDTTAVRPDDCGTKAALHYQHVVPAGGSVTLRLRFTDKATPGALTIVDTIITARKAEADAFYAGLAPGEATADERLVQRRALAGLLWSKQSYLFDVARWLDGDDPAQPPPPSRRTIRNSHWRHLNSMRVMSMPDKSEYPWFAAWGRRCCRRSSPRSTVRMPFARLELAGQVKSVLEQTPGVVDVDWYVAAPQAKTSLVVDESRAGAAAVTASHVSAAVHMATEGRTVGLLHDANAREDVPIVLRLPRPAQGSLAAVRELRLGPNLVAVGELTREETRPEADSLYHKNLLPVTYVTGDLAGADESPVYAILRMNRAIANVTLPAGLSRAI